MSDELKPLESVDSFEFRKLFYAAKHAPFYFDGSTPELAALIAHIDAWRVPAGWKLSPIDSMPEMNRAGRDALRACGNDQATDRDAGLCWSAMIEVAPDKEDACGS